MGWNPKTWAWNPKRWFEPHAYGTYVEVILDGGFGRIEPCTDPDQAPDFRPLLYIRGEHPSTITALLTGRRFNWHTFPMFHRAELELGAQFLCLPLGEVKRALEG